MGMTQQPALMVDSFDKKILNIVQDSNRATSDKIAEKVGLSPAAVQRRLKRMRAQGVIQADVSVINPKAVGHAMTFIVQVTLERERVDLMHNFKKEMSSNRSVQQCYYVTGSSDFIMIVTAADMEGYDNFTREAFFDNANIKSFQTNVVMDNVKVGLTIPIDDQRDWWPTRLMTSAIRKQGVSWNEVKKERKKDGMKKPYIPPTLGLTLLFVVRD